MSSYLIAAPEALATASADLSGIEEAIRHATSAAAPSTTGIVPPAFDEVSAAITRLFGTYGQEFQSLSAQSALFHSRFVQLLSSGGGAYSAAEAANASPLRTLQHDVQALVANPLLPGEGPDGASVVRQRRQWGGGQRPRARLAVTAATAGGLSAMAAMVGQAQTAPTVAAVGLVGRRAAGAMAVAAGLAGMPPIPVGTGGDGGAGGANGLIGGGNGGAGGCGRGRRGRRGWRARRTSGGAPTVSCSR